MNTQTLQASRPAAAGQRIDDSPRSIIHRVLCDAGLPSDLASGYADMICREFTGSAIYFAARSWADVAQRNDEIKAQYVAGRSITWLAREYCLARSYVGRIVSTR